MGTSCSCIAPEIEQDQQLLHITSESDNTDQESIHVVPRSCSSYSLQLIRAFMKINFDYFIEDINSICEAYLGVSSKDNLIAYTDEGKWFESIIQQNVDIFQYDPTANDNHIFSRFETFHSFPITQYIDTGHYQIVFCCIKDTNNVKWSGFLCVNLYNYSVSQLIANASNNAFHLFLSSPLELASAQQYDDCCWIKPIDDECTLIHNMNNNVIGVDFRIWNDFEWALWNQFVSNHLWKEGDTYNNRKQLLWEVIEFLFIIYCQDKQQCKAYIGSLVTRPQILFNAFDVKYTYFKQYFEDNDLIVQQTPRLPTKRYYEPLYHDGSAMVSSGINVLRDCKVNCIKGKMIKCRCYIYCNWTSDEYGLHMKYDHNLYSVCFELSRPNDQVMLNFECQVVKRVIV